MLYINCLQTQTQDRKFDGNILNVMLLACSAVSVMNVMNSFLNCNFEIFSNNFC